MKALIIDDDPDILEVVSLCFEIRWPDATVLRAADGESGFALFKREGADIVILDLGLPGISGLDAPFGAELEAFYANCLRFNRAASQWGRS